MESQPRLSGGRALSPDRPEEASGCPGTSAITNLAWVQEQKLRSPALRDKLRDETQLRRGKKCDKQLTHNVRVMVRYILFRVLEQIQPIY